MRTLILACMATAAASGAGLPVIFEENRGQVASGARYAARLGGADLLLGERVELGGVQLEFAGGGGLTAVGEKRAAARINYYRGRDRGKWIEDVPAFETVRYRAVYAGVDVVFHAGQGELEYDFEVAPGADVETLGVRFHGARKLRLGADGALIFTLPDGRELQQKAPVAYQETAGGRSVVAARYRMDGDVVRFALGEYDRGRKLVIDPVLTFSSWLGYYTLANLAVDGSGNSYVSGRMQIGQDVDAVYMKLDAEGRNLLYRTFVGGLNVETPVEEVVDGSGNLFAVGTSLSADFPVSGTACRSAVTSDVYVLKLGTSGNILASRCFGGADNETAVGIGLDTAGAVYVAGNTFSTDLPVAGSVPQPAKRSTVGSTPFASAVLTGMLAKFDVAGLSTVYATYFGGYGTTTVTDMGVDAGGGVVLVGTTVGNGFPVVAGSYQLPASVENTTQPFVSRLAPGGGSLIYSTMLSGITNAQTLRTAVDASGVAVVGFTASNVLGQLRLIKLAADGRTALFARTIPGWDTLSGLEVDRSGNLLLTGVNALLALTPDMVMDRTGSVVVARMDAAAQNVTYASVLPTAQSDGMARFGPGGSLYLAMSINVNNFPLTAGSYVEPLPAVIAAPARVGVMRVAPGPVCSATVDGSFSLTIPTAGMTGSIPVQAPASCTWIATQPGTFSQWLSFSGANFGTGNGNLPFSAAPLFQGEPGRRAVISLSGNRITLTQGVPAGCPTPQFSPATVTFGPGGGISTAGFQLTEGCAWAATTDANWLTLYQASGSGSGLFYLEAQPNLGTARTATVTVNGQSLIVNQTVCTYFVGNAIQVGDQAGGYNATVTTDLGCGWAVTTSDAWIRLGADAAGRTSGGSFSFQVEENPTGSTRSATLSVGGRQILVTQPGLSCVPAATASAATVGSAGGTVTVTVTIGAGCGVQVSVAQPATVVGTGTLAGTGAVNLTVPVNAGVLPRPFRVTVTTTTGVLKTLQIPLMQDGANPVAPFTDVALGSTFLNHISVMKDKQVTRGCSFDGTRYCPNDAMTRGQMAAFLMRAMNLSNAPQMPYFEDVPPSHPFFSAIQAIRAVGITLGCSAVPARFCPEDPLTRGQMAALIVRAKQFSDLFTYAGTPAFGDVPVTHPFFRHIQRLKDLGITLGCGNGNFCPESTNTRGEMAAFVTRAFLSN